MRLIAILLALALAPQIVGAQADSVLFRIDMNALILAGDFDPATQGVSVRGGSLPLSWTDGLAAADPNADGVYQVVAMFPAWTPDDQPVPYKFKIDDPAHPLEGWEDGPNRFFVRKDGSQTVERSFGAEQPPLPPSFTGDVRVHENVKSRFVENRNVYVYLPPAYDAHPDRRYPVLYLHDGQNVFDVSCRRRRVASR